MEEAVIKRNIFTEKVQKNKRFLHRKRFATEETLKLLSITTFLTEKCNKKKFKLCTGFYAAGN